MVLGPLIIPLYVFVIISLVRYSLNLIRNSLIHFTIRVCTIGCASVCVNIYGRPCSMLLKLKEPMKGILNPLCTSVYNVSIYWHCYYYSSNLITNTTTKMVRIWPRKA